MLLCIYLFNLNGDEIAVKPKMMGKELKTGVHQTNFNVHTFRKPRTTFNCIGFNELQIVAAFNTGVESATYRYFL